MSSTNQLVKDGLHIDAQLAETNGQLLHQYDLAVAGIMKARSDLMQNALKEQTDPLAQVAAPVSGHNGSWKGSMQESARRKGTRDQKYRQNVLTEAREDSLAAALEASFDDKNRRERLGGKLSAKILREMANEDQSPITFDYEAEGNKQAAREEAANELAILTAKYAEDVAAMADATLVQHSDADIEPVDPDVELEERYKDVV